MATTSPSLKNSPSRYCGSGLFYHIHLKDAAFQQIIAEKGYTYINGYDDPAVISGAGTLGLEMLEQLEDAGKRDMICAVLRISSDKPLTSSRCSVGANRRRWAHCWSLTCDEIPST